MQIWNDACAPWAQRDRDTRGRRHSEPEHPYRPAYARDRDRIVHCRAFRRLEYKTQVFVNHEGDHYRTRLTHSLEVSQIARTVARSLGLNRDLAESLALSHDLGHTPFGHLGEDVFDPLLQAEGGFNHNRQTLRVVELLEERYHAFPGLNLTWEVREGIVKHSGPTELIMPEAAEYLPDTPPPLEAQMIDIVDEIAYNHHDVDDGLESGLLELDTLVSQVPMFGRPYRLIADELGENDRQMNVKVALRRMIDRLVTDLIETTHQRLEQADVGSIEDVRQQSSWLVGLSEQVRAENRQLKQYLQDKLYEHPQIVAVKRSLAQVLRELFDAYVDDPQQMPERYRRIEQSQGTRRAVSDYIAGMTDRFALEEHRRLCGGGGSQALPSAIR